MTILAGIYGDPTFSDPILVLSVGSNPVRVLSIRSGPIRSDPIRSGPILLLLMPVGQFSILRLFVSMTTYRRQGNEGLNKSINNLNNFDKADDNFD